MLPNNASIGINGIYHNKAEAENYQWGAGARGYGFSYNQAYTAAQAYGLWKNNFMAFD